MKYVLFSESGIFVHGMFDSKQKKKLHMKAWATIKDHSKVNEWNLLPGGPHYGSINCTLCMYMYI